MNIVQSIFDQTPVPELADYEETEMAAHSYIGLRDVFSRNGEELAVRLAECRADNAWPDWVALYKSCHKARMHLADVAVMISDACQAVVWPQTVSEVMMEIECRNANQFVIQRNISRLTFDGPITVS